MKFCRNRFVPSVCTGALFAVLAAPQSWGEWADPARRFRVRATVPAEERPTECLLAAMPVDMGKDLRQLGVRGEVDASSFRLLAVGPEAREIAASLRDGRVEWDVGARAPGEEAAFDLYFNLTGAPGSKVSAMATPKATPDFFEECFGRPCDFDDGGFGGITSWGNRPEFIRRRVENGILILDVKQDGYFIWGTMWGPEREGAKAVRIDVDRRWMLEIRLRQSIERANWDLYGRPLGKEDLLHHEFSVRGTNWQTARIDLRHDLRWHGVLSALRIDPAGEAAARVDIDWIRLVPSVAARRAAVETLGAPSAAVRKVELVPGSKDVAAGSEQLVAVMASDAEGKPVSGQPVRLWVHEEPGGVFSLNRRAGALNDAPGFASLALDPGARRALTDSAGCAKFRYFATRIATGPERLLAEAEFAKVPSAEASVVVRPCSPHHYVVEPARPRIVRPGERPTELLARRADQFGNPLSGDSPALSWDAPGAEVVPAAPSGSGDARATLRCDPATRWVTSAGVTDAAGLSGRSAPISFLPGGPRPEPVRLLPNGYFAIGGKAWLPLGGFYANWVGLPTPDGEWDKRASFTDATEAQIVEWLKFLKSNGVTALRFMLRSHRNNGMEPMDIGGRVNPGLFPAFLRYLDLARPFGFRFLVVIHEDYSKPCYFNGAALERFCLPWYEGEKIDGLPTFQRRFIRDRRLIGEPAEKYTDRDVIACQDAYAREIIGLLKDNPAVFAYELENEMVNCPATWADHAIATIRSVDPGTPVCVSHGGGGVITADPAWWKAKTSIDFYTYHLYPHGTTSPEMDYGIATDVLTRYGRMGKSAFLGESAGDQFSYGPDRETRRWTMRDVIWFSFLNGNPGCFFWNARASEFAEFRLAAEVFGRVDWATFRREKPPLAIAVPHALDDDKWFRSEAGRAAHAMMGRYSRHYLDRGADFDFVLGETSDHALHAGVDHFAPPDPGATALGVSAGYQLKALVREGGGEAILYARNCAGVRLWECERPHRWIQYLRARKPASLRVTVALPGRFDVEIWDLDTCRHEVRSAGAGRALELGLSDHDFAILLRRR